jgi:O-antigen/teichoic acid export membrane protein
LGAVLSRFFTFWLLPLTTSYLTPADYGIVGNLALLSTLLIGLFQLGMNTSIAPVYYSEKEKSSGIIWGAFLTLALNAMILCAVLGWLREPISLILLKDAGYGRLVFISLLTTAFTACQMPFIFYLRAVQKARLVLILCLMDVLIANSLMILFVMVWERGAMGVVESQCLSLLASMAMYALVILPKLPFSFPWGRVLEMIKVGAPVIYGFLGFFLLQSASRYLIQWYVSEDEAGLFFVGSNFAKVIELALWGFVSAWIPYFNSFVGREQEGAVYFSRVLNYFVFGMSVISLCFFLFARPIVTLMVQEPFYPVWTIVGILSLAQASWGIYVISYTGLVMKKRTFLLSCMEIGAGIGCIGLNALLIPIWKMEGAAVATLLSFLLLIGVSFTLNQRILPVPYDKKRIVQTLLPFTAIAAYSFLPIESLMLYTGVGIMLLGMFMAYLWKWVLHADEREVVLKKFGWSQEPCAEYQQS